MSLDLFQDETLNKLSGLPPVQEAVPGTWEGFARGVGLYTMQGLAKTGRAIDLLGSVGPIIKDAFTGGTVLQDQYFKEHVDIWGEAVKYWTPERNTVGAAGQIVGGFVSTIGQAIASPALAVGSLQLSTAEDLVNEGVDASRANVVGGIQGLTLGTGIWLPILGANFWQRAIIGGAGLNTSLGIGSRALSGGVLKGTDAAEQFKAIDTTALTLDVLLGAAFGTMAHLSPAMRAQGAETWDKIGKWAENLKSSDVDAIATLRQAQHMNVDSTPGTPVSPPDIEAHVQKLKTAIEQLERGQDVNVENMPPGRFEPDLPREAERIRLMNELVDSAEEVRKQEGLTDPRLEIVPRETLPDEGLPRSLPPEPTGEATAPPPSGPEGEVPAAAGLPKAELAALKKDLAGEGFPADVQSIRDADVVARASLKDEAAVQAAALQYGEDYAGFINHIRSIADGKEESQVQAGAEGQEETAQGVSQADRVLANEATRYAEERPDQLLTVGTNPDGSPVQVSAKDYLEQARAEAALAREDAKLFEVAAGCLMGKT